MTIGKLKLAGWIAGAIIIFILTTGSVFAHHSGDHAVVLHTNNRWDECAMVIDPGLTQKDWEIFAKDIASMLYFRPMAGARTLGRFKFDLGLEYGRTGRFKDYDPAWNNTFSHPYETHWLTDNHYLGLPFISARMGINDKVDIGLGYTENYEANYGWVSADLKYAVTTFNRHDIAARVSFTSLTGVADFDIYQGAIDILLSKNIYSFVPYVGATMVYTTAKETTSKVNLSRVNYIAPEGIIGIGYRWKLLNLVAEIDLARINMYALKIGAVF